ncbi:MULTISPECIES: hypothetical protein [Hungatella]|uniref:Uncharacterized protein n=1 Tax=Hungatella hathewayi TaxID=154046 RepID=A0A374NW44_9FIRM|nr:MULTISPECIES: hypothetical protein [Hungatella]RGD71560.1 hypothetical protein DWX31_04550 [Hungatella hathewayi]RGI94864.1 hypothetical protein DXD79_33160 [Hungatella hathewayi]RGK94147.1 hypothetical protein DXC88_18080 [Hungatella hathewayi]RHC39760.1 hypothetical protein DW841_35160 [Hungatella hathewayi]
MQNKRLRELRWENAARSAVGRTEQRAAFSHRFVFECRLRRGFDLKEESGGEYDREYSRKTGI